MDKYVKDSDIYDIVMSQFCASSDETEAALNAIIECTRALPPADVRPVVLCRECIYAPTAPDDGVESGFDLEWPHNDWPNDNPCPFKCPDRWYSRKPAPDFFCANGKRELNT